jgi:L-malate glycosyltransferase
VGRLDDTKHWQGFLHIGDRVVHAGRSQEVQLWMVGGLNADEPAQAHLWAEVKSRQLVRNFRWLPAVDHRAMPSVYRYVVATGGCLVSTSRTESFGVAVLEAMACGLPVVVPEVGALVSLVEEGRTGSLYRFGDVEGAQKAVLSYLEDDESRRRIGEQAAGFARRYSGEQATDHFLGELALAQETGHRAPR